MKEEIETKHFEHTFAVLETNRTAEPLLTKQVEVCAFHHNLSHGFYRVMSVKFLFPISDMQQHQRPPQTRYSIKFCRDTSQVVLRVADNKTV